ncbi:sensor histidine kinase SrrB [Staphylococcus aureus]|nr:sensor histidine kinase SrrB [Staphylococcus aureus]
MKQILINLFQNSKDALCETENAHINIKLSKNLNETATLIFNDNGPGIPSDIQKEIFDPFFTTKEFGSGLGLYLSKKLIEDWNGKIDVSTNPKQGTSFIITLPIAKNKKLE